MLTYEEEGSEAVEQQGQHAVDDGDRDDKDHEDQPEPDGEVHLLVDDVLAEDTEAVVKLVAAGRANVGHGAAHLQGEGGAEGVDVNLLLVPGQLIVPDHVPPIQVELPVQEHVGRPEVKEQDPVVQGLADDEHAEVPVVPVPDGPEELDVLLHDGVDHGRVLELLLEHHRALGLRAKLLQEATLHRPPDFVRQDERSSLNHHYKGYPLQKVSKIEHFTM